MRAHRNPPSGGRAGELRIPLTCDPQQPLVSCRSARVDRGGLDSAGRSSLAGAGSHARLRNGSWHRVRDAVPAASPLRHVGRADRGTVSETPRHNGHAGRAGTSCARPRRAGACRRGQGVACLRVRLLPPCRRRDRQADTAGLRHRSSLPASAPEPRLGSQRFRTTRFSSRSSGSVLQNSGWRHPLPGRVAKYNRACVTSSVAGT